MCLGLIRDRSLMISRLVRRVFKVYFDISTNCCNTNHEWDFSQDPYFLGKLNFANFTSHQQREAILDEFNAGSYVDDPTHFHLI